MSLGATRWIDFPRSTDERGVLTAIESGSDAPFDIKRVFFLHGIRADRGGHAHRSTQQLLVPISGAFTVALSTGCESTTYHMTDPNRGLYVPPMTWLRLYDFTPGAVCLVLTDTYYRESAYVRNWDDFLALKQPRQV